MKGGGGIKDLQEHMERAVFSSSSWKHESVKRGRGKYGDVIIPGWPNVANKVFVYAITRNADLHRYKPAVLKLIEMKLLYGLMFRLNLKRSLTTYILLKLS